MPFGLRPLCRGSRAPAPPDIEERGISKINNQLGTTRNGSGWRTSRNYRTTGRVLLTILSLAGGPPGMAQEPALNYLQHCAGCHLADGSGSARNNVPDMRGVIGLFPRLAEGRAFLIQVAGVSQAPLSADDIAALMNWLLPAFSGAELPRDFAPYTGAEVETLRQHRPADLMALRGELIQQLAALGHLGKH